MVTSTAPAGCSRTSPIIYRYRSPPGVASQSAQRGFRQFGGNDGEKLPFVSDVQRVEAQQFARAAHGIAHRNFFFEQNDAKSAISRQFIQRSGHAAARGIAHPANACAGFAHQRLNQRQHGARVGAQFGFQIEFSSGQQNGNAVIANRAREQNFVAWLHGLRPKSPRPESGGRFL